MPFTKFKNVLLNTTNIDRSFYMHCHGGVRSLIAVSYASKLGFKDPVNMSGGIIEISSIKIPLSKPNKDPVSTL